MEIGLSTALLKLFRGRVAIVLMIGVVGWSAQPAAGQGAIIDNGVIQLGVNEAGHLNVPGGTPSSGTATPVVGLRFLPTNAEAIAPRCLCEGWGVADAISLVSGYANENEGGTFNITPVSFVFTEDSAVSVVRVGNTFEVTHDYHPSDHPNLYEATVTIRNISGAVTDIRYRRVMNWDIEPTAFDEFVTIEGGNAANLLFSSDNGFETANPLGGRSQILFQGNAVDSGPTDHGALFDFGFDGVPPGGTITFKIYYGATATEQAALMALRQVRAEVYSLGQPSTEGGATLGTPNTFIFAFAGVGGDPAVGNQVCIQDDRTGDYVIFDKRTGDYLFEHCSAGFRLQGTGWIRRSGCVTVLYDYRAGRILKVLVQEGICGHRALAVVRNRDTRTLSNIFDRDTRDNPCVCPGP